MNGLDADDSNQRYEVIKLFNEISGEMKGNEILVEKCGGIYNKITRYAENPKGLTEAIKSNIVNELREKLRTINVQSYDGLIKR
ncbi:hypothetical protein [Methanolobus sp. ZRKC5]|uniref:hypothetical protein n=1 Tax=Methanolobus sp. ZRKC5 TaxID=3136295 RepID=UPI00313C1083